MSLAISLPPELLLDIFSIVSDSPSKNYKQYLERSRNLKSFATVHSTWKGPAQKILQQEVYVGGADREMMDDEDLERISSLLIGSKVQGTKYLTVDGHLNELIATTGSATWSQVRYLKLLTSSRNNSSTRMSDFARFPNIQELHLVERYATWNSIDFKPSDKHLQFPELRRITIGSDVDFRCTSQASKAELVKGVQQLVDIALTLFSPSNMPNLRHLALEDDSDQLSKTLILLAGILPQITSLAIAADCFSANDLAPAKGKLDNLRHLSLNTAGSAQLSLLKDYRLDLDSLHLSTWMLEDSEEMISGLIRIAKGEEPKYWIKRVVMYGRKQDIESDFERHKFDLDAFEWRENRGFPPFKDFDGR